ncbi:MAG: class I SAM-dependent methyltransferase [Terriglobia bacterium]
MKAYSDDLAYIHDAGFSRFVKDAAPGLLRHLRQARIPKGVVVDLGCGSGIWALRLFDAGFKVWGVDLSPAMIQMARNRVPSGNFQVGSYFKTNLPPCHAVTALGEPFNYRFDQKNNLPELSRLFRRVYAALRPGGLFIFDIAEPGRGDVPRVRYWEGADWAILVEVKEDVRTQRLTRQLTTFRQVGGLFRRAHETHRLQLYERSKIKRELLHAGFRVCILHRYGRLSFPKSCIGFLASKPSEGDD